MDMDIKKGKWKGVSRRRTRRSGIKTGYNQDSWLAGINSLAQNGCFLVEGLQETVRIVPGLPTLLHVNCQQNRLIQSTYVLLGQHNIMCNPVVFYVQSKGHSRSSKEPIVQPRVWKRSTIFPREKCSACVCFAS